MFPQLIWTGVWDFPITCEGIIKQRRILFIAWTGETQIQLFNGRKTRTSYPNSNLGEGILFVFVCLFVFQPTNIMGNSSLVDVAYQHIVDAVKHRERERERERERDRERETERDRERERQRQRQRDRDRETEREM